VGIDLGTTHIHGLVASLDAGIVNEMEVPTEVGLGYGHVLRATATLIRDLVAASGVSEKRIVGVGMAVAGLVDRDRNVVEFSPDFGWRDADIISDLRDQVPYPIVFDNVSRVMAIGEWKLGDRHRDGTFVCINVGYGIGAGIMIDRVPLAGAHGMSGEFGHIVVDPDSEIRCMCGNSGCLEALASGRAIAEAARDRIASGERSTLALAYRTDHQLVTARAVAEAAYAGDDLAADVLESAARYLGLGIVTLINLFDPSSIVVGGGVAEAGDLFFETVRETVASRSLSRHSRELPISPSSFGPRAAVLGAVSLVLERVLALEPRFIARLEAL
jgi:glucokinase-like ROK family protein